MKLQNLNPKAIIIVGLDVPGTVETGLDDPYRDHKPSSGLIESVKTFGVLLSPRVVKRGKAYHVEDGRRRVLAAREAGIESISCVVVDEDENQPNALRVRASNSYRHEDPVWVKALDARRLKEQGFSVAQICSAFEENGQPISKMTLTNWKRLLDCKPEILEMIKRGEIPPSAGYEIGKSKPEEQEHALRMWERGVIEDDEPEESGGAKPPRKTREQKAAVRPTKKDWAKVQAFYSMVLPEEGDEEDHALDLAAAVLAVVTGEDSTGEGLAPWPTVAAQFRKAVK